MTREDGHTVPSPRTRSGSASGNPLDPAAADDHHEGNNEVVTMPTYDYRCQACRRSFQIVQTISAHEKAKSKCPKCKSTKVERVLSVGFVKTSKKS